MTVNSGKELENEASRLAELLGLETLSQFKFGFRRYGGRRRIDLLVRANGRQIGIECKFQKRSGTAYEKIPATIWDIESWPFDGIVVVHGDGFPRDFIAAMRGSSGKLIDLEELSDYLVAYFNLEPVQG